MSCCNDQNEWSLATATCVDRIGSPSSLVILKENAIFLKDEHEERGSEAADM